MDRADAVGGRGSVTVAIIGVGALATPFDNLKPAITSPAVASEDLSKKMTPDLYRALTWIPGRRRPARR